MESPAFALLWRIAWTLKMPVSKVLEEVHFVDRVIFGRMNYNKEVTAYKEHKKFFNEKAAEVIAFCNER